MRASHHTVALICLAGLAWAPAAPARALDGTASGATALDAGVGASLHVSTGLDAVRPTHLDLGLGDGDLTGVDPLDAGIPAFGSVSTSLDTAVVPKSHPALLTVGLVGLAFYGRRRPDVPGRGRVPVQTNEMRLQTPIPLRIRSLLAPLSAISSTFLTSR